MTDKYTLIANSGIQFLKVEMELNPNDNIVRALRFYDHKQYDRRMFQTSYFLERAEYLANQDVWVTYGSLVREGCINEKTGKIIEEKINLDDLDKIENDEEKLSINSFETNIQKSLYRDKTAIEHIENKWLPIPFFEKSEDGKSTFGATNWARMFLSPKKVSGGKKGSRFYDVILAFDTCALSGDEDQKWEYPWFSSRDVKKTFAMCSDLENLFNYVNTKECSWVDDYLFKLFHGGDWDVLTALDSGFSKYKAYYIYIMYYLAMKGGLPEVVLFNDKSNDAEQVKVDLVLDIGNSRTCGLLFEDSDFTKVSMLELQDMTHPERSYCDPFDMRLAFREAIFGEIIVQYNNQFTWSSILRVGEEASWLIYNTKNTDNDGAEKVTHYSSPKRYLWDSEQFKKQWEYILLEGEERNQRNSDIHIDGITTQFHNDGTFCRKPMDVGSSSSFSRQALSTFVFLEILSQAQRQANSHEFREKHGQISYPRRINRIIITCPTAMTREEQIRLRRCAEEASLVLRRFIDGTYNKEYDPKHDKSKVQIVPSVKELSYDLQSIDLKKEWGFDEATCCQLVYIYAEVSKRYLNNCREYFDLYGKKRNDLDDYDKKSITIGSIDIGAGTTDLMICAYKYGDEATAALTPVPLFWESFYYAGDDLLKSVIHQIIIEGNIEKEEYRGAYGVIYNKLIETGNGAEANAKINNFFGTDSAQMNFRARKIRNEFNTQVSVPVALKLLDMTQKREQDRTLVFGDFFGDKKPNKELLDYFATYFGFRFEDLTIKFSLKLMNEIITVNLEPLLKQLSALLYAYGCDFVLLAGKPMSLHQIEELFLKFYPAPPNRIITLNKYRVGRWYPFADGNGYFKDQKSLVAVGAMIGYMGDILDKLGNFKLNMDVMRKRYQPTSEYFGHFDRINNIQQSFIEPTVNNSRFIINGTPACIGTKQLDTPSYTARAIYVFDFDKRKMAEQIAEQKYGKEHKPTPEEKEYIDGEVEKYELNIKRNMPLVLNISREYTTDKELLKVENITDRNRNDISPRYFNMKLRTLSEESDSYWLDTGVFALQINNRT